MKDVFHPVLLHFVYLAYVVSVLAYVFFLFIYTLLVCKEKVIVKKKLLNYNSDNFSLVYNTHSPLVHREIFDWV